ncbi:MAG: DNA polymerase I [Coxiellaceae bacterium]|nr:DNA polymerase I [Coxiellaceae bacterium]
MPESQKNTLVLVDGSSYLFRAYHALPELNNAKGIPTGAAYGVINMLRSLVKEYNTSHIAVVFDAKGKTTRHEIYPDYKANRPEMPEDLRVQIEPLHNMIRALGLPLIIQPGIEADDLIGTLAERGEQAGLHVIISTGDKDMAQLVTPKVSLVNTMSQTEMDEAGVEAKFGVKPDQIIDYLALMGDTVDNIPGVPKVGPKTAAKWLAQYDSLDNIMQHADEFKGKVGQYLRDSLEFLPLAKQLVTIDCDIEMSVKIDDCVRHPIDTEQLRHLFAEFEFKRWLKELDSTDANVIPAEQATEQLTEQQNLSIDTILSQQQFEDCLEKCKAATVLALDTETTSINPMQADLVGLSLAWGVDHAVYIPLAHDYLGAPQQLDKKTVLTALQPILENKKIKIIGQNLKYDIKVLRRAGCDLNCQWVDTMLQSYVLDPAANRHDLDTLAEKYLGHKTIHFEDIAGKGKKQLTFNQISLEQAAPYAGEDAAIALQLYHHFHVELEKDKELLAVLNDLEMPLMPILAEMEYTGVLIDAAVLHKQSQALAKTIQKFTDEIFSMAGEEFNIDSPKQLLTILYEKLQLPILKKTPKGQPSTAEPVLTELSHDYPLPKAILSYRSLVKLKSTYTDKLPLEINPDTGRVHTSYRQAATSTGRLASNNPNLQNIPVRSEEGRAIRKAFIAPKGFQVMSADYSQIELRIMAHLSADKGLTTAFNEGLDVHKATAAEVFGVPLDKVTADQRRSAKAINFGLIYGMSAFGLGKQLGIDRNSAQEYMDTYFARYPGVHEYMAEARHQARKQGYVSTLYGRKLQVPEINSSNKMRQNAAERAAINAPMQGTAADIIKRAMIAVDQWLHEHCPQANMIMQVHDELVFELPEQQAAACMAGIKACMENAAQLHVPLIVDMGLGNNWEEAH